MSVHSSTPRRGDDAARGQPTRQPPGNPQDPSRDWRLGRRARKAVLVVHLVSAGAWIGIDTVMAILVFTALLTDDPNTTAVSYQALELFAIWPLLLTGLTCLASGVTLGLGTKYGLARYWWVVAKLVINVAFVALVPLSLRPTVTEAATYGRQLMPEAAVTFPATNLLFPAIVSPTGLLIAVLLAVYKPWGRIHNRS